MVLDLHLLHHVLYFSLHYIWRSRSQKESQNQNKISSLKRAIFEQETKLEFEKRKERIQILKEEQQKTKNLKEFTSGKINWKLKTGTLFYPVWEGYYQNKHVFNIIQKQTYFELNLVQKSEKSMVLEDIKKKAELFIDTFTMLNKKK